MERMRLPALSPHQRAVLQALFVTLLWATSWVLIKVGLREIPALTFAGLRYFLAFLVLLPLLFRSGGLAALRTLSSSTRMRLLWLGLLLYAITQGTQFLGLAYLPAVTVSLLLNFTTVVVALLGMIFLAERPSWLQWSGIGLALVGSLLYFYPAAFPATELLGLSIVACGVLANALSAVIGREINRDGSLSPVVITTVSMGIGSTVLLVSGISLQGLPDLTLSNWLLIVWLAVVNTAFAFTVWNLTLRTLSAVESSVINNTLLIQIAVLAWIFLGETITWREGIGLLLAGAGAVLVQLRWLPAGIPRFSKRAPGIEGN